MKKINLSQKWMIIGMVACFGATAIYSTTHKDNKYFEISKNIEIFTNIYKEANTYYVDEIDPAKLMRTGVDAMLGSLDPYTNYISEAEMEGFRFMTTGKYGGIGAVIRKIEDQVVIIEPYEGYPADKAGLKAGDILLEIDGKSAIDKNTDAISNILRGSPGTEVSVKVKRGVTGKVEMLKLIRAEVRQPNVPYSGEVIDGIGYIHLSTFTEKAVQNVAEAFKDLDNKNDLKGIIFDLRGNGGGLLKEAINISNIFVEKNEEVVVTRGKIKDWDKNFKTLNKPLDLDIPLVVLINNGSASASEIVSGVIQDFDRGVLIGSKSYGKGLVQNTRDVGYNSKVKLTTAKYYIPSGRCIQALDYKDGKPVEISDSLKTPFKTRNGRTVYDGGGIEPDILVENEEYPNVMYGLVSKNLIFDYATLYASKHTTIADAKSFKLTDADYQDFKNFVKQKSYAFETDSERQLKKLKEYAEEENYLSSIENDLATIENKIKAEKEKDFDNFKPVILKQLEREIVKRYHYRKGQIEYSLQHDDEIKEALSLFKDPARYKKLLEN